jgi:hypothetical protein
MNNIQGWRTLIAGILTIFFGVLASTDWVSFLNDPKAGIMVICSGLIMIIMRTVTSTPPITAIHPAEVHNKTLMYLNDELLNKNIMLKQVNQELSDRLLVKDSLKKTENDEEKSLTDS